MYITFDSLSLMFAKEREMWPLRGLWKSFEPLLDRHLLNSISFIKLDLGYERVDRDGYGVVANLILSPGLQPMSYGVGAHYEHQGEYRSDHELLDSS